MDDLGELSAPSEQLADHNLPTKSRMIGTMPIGERRFLARTACNFRALII